MPRCTSIFRGFRGPILPYPKIRAGFQMAHKITTVAVLGAGAAGLSLAREVLEAQTPPSNLRIILCDGRQGYHNDRTWCFFEKPDHDLSHLVRKSWAQWSLSDHRKTLVYTDTQTPYQLLAAGAYYDYCLSLIEKSEYVDLLLGCPVRSFEKRNGKWTLSIDDGEIEADYIIDTRPPAKDMVKSPFLNQSFYGMEIQTREPCFNPDRALLMDHLRSDEFGLSFVYLLPFSEREALIEWTRFTPEFLSEHHLKNELEAILPQYINQGGYDIIRQETGHIPMGFISNQNSEAGYFPAGTRGGAVRASTGYAFQRIQRWASTCARSLIETGRPVAHPQDKRLDAWMDRIFLKVLLAYPDLAPKIKMNLAGGLSSRQFTRFLTDRAYLRDNISIIRSQPVWPFLKTAIKDMIGK